MKSLSPSPSFQWNLYPSGIIIVSDKDRKGGVSIMKKQTRDDLMGLGFMFLLLMTAIGIRAYIWL